MRYSSLLKVAKISIAMIIIIIIVFFSYIHFKGEKIDDRLAGVICAKLINDYIDNDFIITKVNFDESYKFNQVKVDLSISYGNGKDTTSFCYYKKKYSDSTISLIKAELRDIDGKLKTFSNLEVIYKK
ncbi:MAG: hypothetical protein LBH40_05420 [Alphaproteobacteria bacterium]|nr:hypothetical protein [Alphaproteobacteria bacterium]